MARAQAIIVGGGIGASPAFTSTDEAQGRGVIITSEDPATVGAANFGEDSSGFVWISGGLTDTQRATNLQRGVFLGRDLQNLATLTTETPVIIGFQAGSFAGVLIGSNGVAIGAGARAGGQGISIGGGVVGTAAAGSSKPVLIGCTGATHVAMSSLVAIGESTSITIASGVVIAGRVTTNGGVTFNEALCIQGVVENGRGICLSGRGLLAGTNGEDCIAIGGGSGSVTRAGGASGGTAYNKCIAIGNAANATGSGASFDAHAIAIGDTATVTVANGGTGAIAIGRSATATDKQCKIGSATGPLRLMIAAGPFQEPLVTITYSASMTPDASAGNYQVITATNATAFTINAPTNTPAATFHQQLVIKIRNTSGGALGAATFNAVFKLGAAWTQPANGFSRTVQFEWDGTNWVESFRSAADVAN